MPYKAYVNGVRRCCAMPASLLAAQRLLLPASQDETICSSLMQGVCCTATCACCNNPVCLVDVPLECPPLKADNEVLHMPLSAMLCYCRRLLESHGTRVKMEYFLGEGVPELKYERL